MVSDLNDIPHAPGVYLMRDRTGSIIYVGKAVDLKSRVKSYFYQRNITPKIASLIANIQRFDYIIANNEQESLILENKLIKKYQPRYNTLLRDDKTFPYLVLTTAEKFPRLFLTRKKRNDKNVYFGPYPFVAQVRGLIKWLIKNFNLRPCKEKLDQDIEKNKRKYSSCLYMHIKKCPAPCIGGVSAKEYSSAVQKLKLFLNGKHRDLLNIWKKEMKKASKKLQFERASNIRDRIQALEYMYERVRFRKIEEGDLAVSIKSTQALSELKKVLDLKTVPLNIEAFDISNIIGKYAVGSLVRFKNGRPDKSNYRMYKIRGFNKINDTGMIKEVVGRRYRRLLKESTKLPQLIMVDGGSGQLNSAKAALDELKISNINLISIAKENDDIYAVGKKESLSLSKDSSALTLLRYIRDESHRFAISFYRKLHRKEMLENDA
ncbi:MAG: excinuclease ABC subunit UvrC [bacterium]